VPKRDDLQTLMLIGSGPIVIGQACEFDYSGTQAVKALKEEGYRVVLVNSNPATIMTDPELCDRTYVEPLTVEFVEQVIARERPQALLPTMGGQTALNLALDLNRAGVLDKYGVELIGAQVHAIEKAEDRMRFKAAMERIGLQVPESGYVRSIEEARRVLERIGLPAVIRPSFTLGGAGGNIARTREEYDEQVRWALQQSPRGETLIEESVLGWKEFELEVMRDRKDNVVIVCSIENFDPMGVHTGDSITVAPAMTLTDKEYQRLRDASVAIIREIGVDTGGSNIQFAVHPADGRVAVIEMNPRVSRSSALASKATGFPIAKIAAKLAVGYTLDEITNDITRETPASFEPSIDYVVVKVPRFAFDKFPAADASLTTQMKSVGEVMAIGRTFQEALSKAVRSLEIDRWGLGGSDLAPEPASLDRATPDRLWRIAAALRGGASVAEIFARTGVDPWFLENLRELVVAEGRASLDAAGLREAKRLGVSDVRIAAAVGSSEDEVRAARERAGIRAVFKRVDTCAAEFEAHTPYLYSTYEGECEANPTTRRKVMILGGGPNRIGQGIEFDYCCCHAAFALRAEGFETIMVNCNPETVSTDYDTSDRLYFEPLTREDVLRIVEVEKPMGVIVQFGGQTPLKLALPLARAGVPILGTSAEAIDRAEDRGRFGELLGKLGLRAPAWGTARSVEDATRVVREVGGFPVMVRPSYVLGGRAMEIVHDDETLARYVERAFRAEPGQTLLVDAFLRDAIEIDVDAVSDGRDVVIGGIMEHIEEAGVHSGDSACVLPPFSLDADSLRKIREQTRALALELGVVGLMNVQFAIRGPDLYVLEVNPRGSRTVPFVSKAIGVPLAKIAARVMIGRTLAELGVREVHPAHVAVKEAVFPFVKFPGVDVLLGPEMKSTGEVMGLDADYRRAFLKAQVAAHNALPVDGTVFLSVRDEDKRAVTDVARRLRALGFHLVATRGTSAALRRVGIECETVNKVLEGSPHVVERIEGGGVQMVINTTSDAKAVRDSFSIRRSTLQRGIAYFTTLSGAEAGLGAIEASVEAARGNPLTVRALQAYHPPDLPR
jgi:carbamoyl-phosphate synthase large subunit